MKHPRHDTFDPLGILYCLQVHAKQGCYLELSRGMHALLPTSAREESLKRTAPKDFEDMALTESFLITKRSHRSIPGQLVSIFNLETGDCCCLTSPKNVTTTVRSANLRPARDLRAV